MFEKGIETKTPTRTRNTMKTTKQKVPGSMDLFELDALIICIPEEDTEMIDFYTGLRDSLIEVVTLDAIQRGMTREEVTVFINELRAIKML